MTIKKGDKFLCVGDVFMNETDEQAYTQGKVYTSHRDGCITNNYGDDDRAWGCEAELFFDRHYQDEVFATKPSHYANGIDTFARMEANCTKEECLAFAKGNIDKYNWRTKGQDLEDFDKIIAYAEWAKKMLK